MSFFVGIKLNNLIIIHIDEYFRIAGFWSHLKGEMFCIYRFLVTNTHNFKLTDIVHG